MVLEFQRNDNYFIENFEYTYLKMYDKDWHSPFCMEGTVGCCYNMAQYCKILHKWFQELRQNINQMLDPQKTP